MRFLFTRNASCTGVNSVCQLLEGKAIDAALSICHLIMLDSIALFKLTAERSKLRKQVKIACELAALLGA